ncbi:hypothetical protein GCM10009541_35660 [Micromonospora gifhornensis]|uniref:Uncharacterized protein n=1 Tax=Micromonospora gifhornensis TaxID=84594 RepID=A0ABQ4IJJ7_9ACTN|nr:hypothetical protein Vgi01_47560 [Micromonospora gifhornensis]
MSDPLETTPCSRPSANSTKGTFANLRGRAGGTTASTLLRRQAVPSASVTCVLPAPVADTVRAW